MALGLLIAALPLLIGSSYVVADVVSAEGCTADLAIGIVLDKSGSLDQTEIKPPPFETGVRAV